MGDEQNAETVGRLFEAFGRGDIPGAMEFFAEDVDFRSPVTRIHHQALTWARPRHGREEVRRFFGEMAAEVRPEPFEVLTLVARDDMVAVEGRNRGTVNATGVQFVHDWAMFFSFRDGRIVRCYHYYDTADLLAAF
ncbi:nuclear transport factor 2 family protein [Methanoculleus caldifontis]|nr:nuclear transport factor 2 family protein [Methanoculleus sp. Wushi-C6]